MDRRLDVRAWTRFPLRSLRQRTRLQLAGPKAQKKESELLNLV
jgi:hypothetical protein